MARARRSAPTPARELGGLRRDLEALERRLEKQEARVRALTKAVDTEGRRGRVIAEALRLGDRAKSGDRGILRELEDSIVRTEDYLLKTAERIENILTALKQHREFLMNMNKRVLDVGAKDRIRLELDVMKNTLSILALNGIEFDAALVKDIDGLRRSLKDAEDVGKLERAKADLDKKFDEELKKFDLEAVWSRKKEIPGYR